MKQCLNCGYDFQDDNCIVTSTGDAFCMACVDEILIKEAESIEEAEYHG